MTPAEHKAEAERLAKLAVDDFPATPIERDVVALAQVHATLATIPSVPPAPENITGWLYCCCPRQPDGQMASFGRRVTSDRNCPIHGEQAG